MLNFINKYKYPLILAGILLLIIIALVAGYQSIAGLFGLGSLLIKKKKTDAQIKANDKIITDIDTKYKATKSTKQQLLDAIDEGKISIAESKQKIKNITDKEKTDKKTRAELLAMLDKKEKELSK